MELKLQQLIDNLIATADVRNLSATNPITFTIKNPNSNDNVIVVVAIREPYTYNALPINVTWINYDPEDVNFKRALKRVNKDDPGPGSPYEHTWQVLNIYNDVFEPPQYYDGGVSDIDSRFDFHVDDNQNPNPHNITPEIIDALALSGGTLTGPVVIRQLGGGGDAYAVGEAIPREYVDSEITILQDQITTLAGQISVVSGSTYKHDQSGADSTWSITHNLNTEDIIIQIFDENGYLMFPSEAHSTGLNTAEILFEENLIGTALIVPVA